VSLGDRLAFVGAHCLGDNDQGEVSAGRFDALDLPGDVLELVRYLRDQDHVGTAGDAGVQRDMTRVPSHDLEDHHSIMAGCRWLQVIERVGSGSDGARIADRVFGYADVVVDRLRHADELPAALLGEAAKDCEAAVAADTDQGIQTQFPIASDHLLGAVDALAVRHRKCEGITLVRGSEYRPTHAQGRAVKAGGLQRFVEGRPDHQSVRSLLNSNNLPAIVLGGVKSHRPNDGIETGTIASARKDPQALNAGHAVCSPNTMSPPAVHSDESAGAVCDMIMNRVLSSSNPRRRLDHECSGKVGKPESRTPRPGLCDRGARGTGAV